MILSISTPESDNMIYDWVAFINEVQYKHDDMIKQNTEFFMPFVATSMNVIKTIYSIAQKFDLPNRAKYLAIHLYDTYMCNKFEKVYRRYENDVDSNTDQWDQLADKLSSQAKLRLMSCIQIASKVDSHPAGLSISQVTAGMKLLDSLNNEEQEYNSKTIFKSEIKVFKTLKFRIPLIIPLDCLEILLAALDIQDMPKLYDTAINILDLTYLHHESLYRELQFISIGTFIRTKEEKIDYLAMKTDMLFLSASVILCSTFFFERNQEKLNNIADDLHALTGIRSDDIFAMASTIFRMGKPE